jgi:hypothetical protein
MRLNNFNAGGPIGNSILYEVFRAIQFIDSDLLDSRPLCEIWNSQSCRNLRSSDRRPTLLFTLADRFPV